MPLPLRCTVVLRSACLIVGAFAMGPLVSASGAVTLDGSVNPSSVSDWNNTTDGYVGYAPDLTGSAVVDAASVLTSKHGILGHALGATGTATVTGSGSQWASGSILVIGSSGNGMLNIEAGGQVSSNLGYLGYSIGSTGTATVTGTGSKWTNTNGLYVGEYGSGTLTVSNGGSVTAGTLYASLGSLLGDGTISAKGAVLDAALVFDSTHGLQQTLTFGAGGTLNLNLDGTGELGAGHKGAGTLRIADGVTITSYTGYVGYAPGSNGTVTVTGANSKWTGGVWLYVGYSGSGSLNIESGGCLSGFGLLGYHPGATGIVTVTGADSQWVNSGNLRVGNEGVGTLSIMAGGQVSSSNGYVGMFSGSTGTATITGTDSKWINSGGLYVGNGGNGALRIEAGGQVSNTYGYLGHNAGSTGTATVAGSHSTWSSTGTLYVGYSGNGTLEIGGGVVKAQTFCLASSSGTTGTTNLHDGGTLETQTMSRGAGTATFDWNDGTIQDYDAGSELTVASSLTLKLAATGKHAFNIDANRTGMVAAVLADATTGGTLAKMGAGTLTLSADNTYSGGTVVEAGTFKVTGSVLGTSRIDVAAGATLELARTSGSATAATLLIGNDGTFVVSKTGQLVGTVAGSGVTQVSAAAGLSADSIVQDTLSVGAGGAVTIRETAGGSSNAVPEPSTFVLLGMCAVGLLGFAWRRRKRTTA